jgi:menaquinone-dependent protoporphyrinogen IX oxidase
LCRELRQRGAAGVVVADLDGAMAEATATELGGIGLQCDVADAAAVHDMVD